MPRARTARRALSRSCSVSRRTKQTAATTTSGCSKATITLRVHPRYGQEVRILRAYGPDALWVEVQDGEHTVLPVAWTDWYPRTKLPEVGNRAVRIAPEAAKSLAAYAAAHRGENRQDDGSSLGPTERSGTDEPHASAEMPTTDQSAQRQRQDDRRRAPVAMVEQAGAPKTARGNGSGKRGER